MWWTRDLLLDQSLHGTGEHKRQAGGNEIVMLKKGRRGGLTRRVEFAAGTIACISGEFSSSIHGAVEMSPFVGWLSSR